MLPAGGPDRHASAFGNSVLFQPFFAPIVGILAPTGTPKAIMDKIAADVVAVTKTPEAQKQLAGSGIEAVGGGSDDYAKAIADENARMAKAIDAAGIKPE